MPFASAVSRVYDGLVLLAHPLGVVAVSRDAVLEHVRRLVNNLLEQPGDVNKNASLESPSTNGSDSMDKMLMDWCFIDCNQTK